VGTTRSALRARGATAAADQRGHCRGNEIAAGHARHPIRGPGVTHEGVGRRQAPRVRYRGPRRNAAGADQRGAATASETKSRRPRALLVGSAPRPGATRERVGAPRVRETVVPPRVRYRTRAGLAAEAVRGWRALGVEILPNSSFRGARGRERGPALCRASWRRALGRARTGAAQPRLTSRSWRTRRQERGERGGACRGGARFCPLCTRLRAADRPRAAAFETVSLNDASL
jgi:hypothetical protein